MSAWSPRTLPKTPTVQRGNLGQRHPPEIPWGLASTQHGLGARYTETGLEPTLPVRTLTTSWLWQVPEPLSFSCLVSKKRNLISCVVGVKGKTRKCASDTQQGAEGLRTQSVTKRNFPSRLSANTARHPHLSLPGAMLGLPLRHKSKINIAGETEETCPRKAIGICSSGFSIPPQRYEFPVPSPVSGAPPHSLPPLVIVVG